MGGLIAPRLRCREGTMKLSTLPAAPAAALLAIAWLPARGADPHAEVVEWVTRPCMEVAAALDVRSYKEDQFELVPLHSDFDRLERRG